MRRGTHPTLYRCPGCKKVQVIRRINGQRRKKGHLKALWCTACHSRTNHIQIS